MSEMRKFTREVYSGFAAGAERDAQLARAAALFFKAVGKKLRGSETVLERWTEDEMLGAWRTALRKAKLRKEAELPDSEARELLYSLQEQRRR